MNNKKPHTAAVIVLAAATLALSGCAAIDDLVHRQETQTYDSKELFDADTSVDADWIPSDATAITLRTPADDAGDVAVVLLTSASELPESCVEAERSSAPMLTIDGAPDVYDSKNSTVQVCDDWTVLKATNRWFGWTPNQGD
ncbi:MAG: hypothetical protein ACKVI4_08655 [Actinomycetales bacterium]